MPAYLYLKKTILLVLLGCNLASAQTSLVHDVEKTMYNAAKYMNDSVSTSGGYVWYYLPDLSRRWGEMEAYKTMVWVQDGGTVSIGNVFLDAYEATQNEYYYQLAGKAAGALMAGQSKSGGWNYMIDFAGEASLKKWYATIGKNGWRLEEFQHYYGNDTYDDDVTSAAARFLLRMYLVKRDPIIKSSLDKAITFMLISQYPNGGWPQRYPVKPDYTAYYTFNDDVIWENVLFLMQCYQAFGEERFITPIMKGMEFYLLVQHANGAWGQQYNLNMQVAGARTYEPAAFLPRYTFNNCLLLLKFYQYTGDQKFLTPITKAINWLESVKLPMRKTVNGKYTHSLFIDPSTNQPIYVHRKGSNVKYGYYYVDTVDVNLLAHMQGKVNLNLNYLKAEFARVQTIDREEVKKSSLNIIGESEGKVEYSEEKIKSILQSLDSRNRWLVKHVMISHPYIGDGKNKAETDEYTSTNVGDETDTSPFKDTTEQEYISTPAFIQNMEMLIGYLKSSQKNNATRWKLRDTVQVGKHRPLVLGHPKLMIEGNERALFFNGIQDGLIIPSIPIEGCSSFTIEVMFKPDSDGPVAPRIIHFEDRLLNRGTLELRLTKNRQWYFDGFLKNGKKGVGVTLIDSSKLHPTDEWHWAALVYTGSKMISYVNGEKELEREMDMPLFTKGDLSIGVRLNKQNWFKGQIREIIFHPVAVDAEKLMR